MIAPAVSHVARQNEELKQTFAAMGLDVTAVWEPSPRGPADDNRQLRALLQWVRAYRACPDRDALQAQGYLFPPVEPAEDPDADWVRFTRWVRGLPLSWTFAEQGGELRPGDGMDDGQVADELDRITGILADRGVLVELQDGVPARTAYAYLRETLLESAFEYLPANATIHLTGCTGYCPGCFQRAWCDLGALEEWPEDSEPGSSAA